MIKTDSKNSEKSENQLFSEKWIVKTNNIMVKKQVILFLSLLLHISLIKLKQ